MGGGHKPARDHAFGGLTVVRALKLLVAVALAGSAYLAVRTLQAANLEAAAMDRSSADRARLLRQLDVDGVQDLPGPEPDRRARQVLERVQSTCSKARERAERARQAAPEAPKAAAVPRPSGGWHPWVTNTDKVQNPPPHFPVCSWAGQAKYKPDPVARELKFVRTLNKLKLNYTMHAGSLLGAFRHGGRLTGDGDCDLRFPVWQNEVGREVCEEYARRNPDNLTDTAMPDDNEEMLLKFRLGEGEWEERFCGQTRSQWVKTVKEHFTRVQMPRLEAGERFSLSPSAWGGFRTSTGCDFVVSIHDDEISDSHFCRCPWHDTFAMCMEDVERMLDRHFKGHDRWQVPARRSQLRDDQAPATETAPAATPAAAAPAAPATPVSPEDAVLERVCKDLLE